MLELRNISKTYKPKEGAPVRALKSVTLSFDDRGMVFVLGKSGCGKSTLLNLIGGLDIADSGEIIIEGKSTGSFKESDYDRYRNEYIGFIFQEYNLLEDMTVGENISLAMELQGNTSDKGRLEEILEQVGLKGYAQRKTNELSGGQKQRVAIARAMVKNPKIIMADEPTGALDSTTGKAILDTLKELSESRLVIVVSHDREFAEQYGDRIIELEDGEVIKDENRGERNKGIKEREKTEKSERTFKSAGLPYRRALTMGVRSIVVKPIRFLITIILCVVALTFFGLSDTIASFDKSKATYDSIIKNQYDTVAVVSGGGALNEDIEYLKKKIGVEFSGVVNFGDSPAELPLIYPRRVKGKSGESEYYNAKLYGYLPAEKVIGDKYKLIAGAMPENIGEIVVSKYIFEQFALGGIKIFDGENTHYIEPEEIDSLDSFVEKAYFQVDTEDGATVWKVVGVVDTLEDPQDTYKQFKPNADNDMTEEAYKFKSRECREYFAYSYHSLGYITAEAYGYLSSLHKNDGYGIGADGNITFEINGKGETIAFLNTVNDKDLDKLEILWADGVVRTALNWDEFVIGVNAVEKLSKCFSPEKTIKYEQKYFDGLVDFLSLELAIGSVKEILTMYISICEYAQSVDSATLKGFENFINGIGVDVDDEGKRQMLRAIALSECVGGVKDFLKADFEFDVYAQDFSDAQWRMIYAGYLMINKIDFSGMLDEIAGGYKNNVLADQPSGEEIYAQNGKKIFSKIIIGEIANLIFDNAEVSFNYGEQQKKLNFMPKIVGVYFDDSGLGKDQYIVNNRIYEEATKSRKPEFVFLIAEMPNDKNAVKQLVDLHFDEEKTIYIINSATLAMEEKGDMFVGAGKIFLYVSLGLAIFSIILMSNYIAVSISVQKRKIGILRSLGAKGKDVFAVFLNQSLILSLVNFVLSALATFATSFILNSRIVGMLGMEIELLSFGVRQIALLLLISLATTILSSFIPIYNLSKKKPIDCLRG